LITSSKIYIQILVHNKALLEKEITELFPSWNKISENHSLIIYETGRAYSIEEIGDLPISFSIGRGKYIDKVSQDLFDSKLEEARQIFSTSNIHRWDLVGDDIQMGDRKARGAVIDCFKDNNDTHIGIRFQVRGDFAPFIGESPIPLNHNAPSYEYQCLAESFKHFRPLVAHDEIFLDIDGHEGGRAYYLLEKGFRVIGLDKIPVHKSINDTFTEDYLQIDNDFSEINGKSFKAVPPIDWVVTKINTTEIKKLKKIIKLLESHFESRGMMITVSVSDSSDIIQILDLIRSSSFSVVRTGQLPSHKKEFSIIATR
jgi:hypothetical protein